MLTCGLGRAGQDSETVDASAARPRELWLVEQLDRMEKMLVDLGRAGMHSKEVDPPPRPALRDMALSPVQEHVAPASEVSARTPAREMETKPKETSEVLPTTPATELETKPKETSDVLPTVLATELETNPPATMTSDEEGPRRSVSHARKFDRTKARFQDADDGRFWRCMHRIFPKEDPERTGPLADFVRSRLFERLSFTAIILSVCFTIYKVDYIANALSEEKEIWLKVGEMTILGIFIGELVMKMMVHGGHIFMSKDGGWNFFDFIIVSLATIELVLEKVSSGGIEVGVMRVIRLLRVLKILRVFRAFRFLDELRLMVSCMLGSMASLLWSSVLIMVILLIASLAFVQMVSQLQIDFPEKIAADPNLQDMIDESFSSVRVAMLELFMSTTGGREWGPLYDVVKQSGYTGAIAFVLYIVFFTFAFVNIVTSIFVDDALKRAEPDHASLILQKRR